MILTLQLPDELFQVFAARDPKNPQKEIVRVLEEFKGLAPDAKRVVLSGEALREISRILGMSISSPEQLKEYLQRSEKVSLGDGISLELNPGQRLRLKAQADFLRPPSDTDPEAYFRNFVKQQVTAGVVAIVGP